MSTADIQILTSEYHSTLKRTRTLANWLIPGVGQVKHKMRLQYLPVLVNKKMFKERQRRNRTTQERWSPTDQIWDNLAIEILISNGSELSKIQSRGLMIEINEYIHKRRERTSSFLQQNAN